MIRAALLSTCLLLAMLPSSLEAQQWAQKMFKVTEHDFGSVARDSKAEFAFELTNIYLEDVRIAGVHSTCGCSTPRVVRNTLKTYETGTIVAHVNTERFLGRKGATITVTFDKPYYAQVQLRVSVFIRDDVVFDPGSVQFGTIDQGVPATTKVSVRHIGRSAWEIVGVNTSNPHLSIELQQTQRRAGRVEYELAVSIDGNAPPGHLRDHRLLVTNDRSRPQVPLLVEGCVVSGVVVSPASLFMGVVEPGQEVTRQLVVRGKQPFRIVSIDCDDSSFRFDISGAETAKAVHLVPVKFTAGTVTGKILRSIRIQTDSGASTAPELSAYAVVTPDAGP